MKVLFVINSLATGGAEKIILDLIPSLTENGVVVKLLLLDDSPTPFGNIKKTKRLPNCRHRIGQGLQPVAGVSNGTSF